MVPQASSQGHVTTQTSGLRICDGRRQLIETWTFQLLVRSNDFIKAPRFWWFKWALYEPFWDSAVYFD